MPFLYHRLIFVELSCRLSAVGWRFTKYCAVAFYLSRKLNLGNEFYLHVIRVFSQISVFILRVSEKEAGIDVDVKFHFTSGFACFANA
jgi:hypothetical protein